MSLVQFYVLQALMELYPEKNPYPLKSTAMLDKVCGTDYVRTAFGKRMKVEDIVEYWSKDVEAFRRLSQIYYLYR